MTIKWFNIIWGGFSAGIARHHYSFFACGTDFYGRKGIYLYLPKMFQFWMLFDFNKYEAD